MRAKKVLLEDSGALIDAGVAAGAKGVVSANGDITEAALKTLANQAKSAIACVRRASRQATSAE
jgi:hypothetical protein